MKKNQPFLFVIVTVVALVLALIVITLVIANRLPSIHGDKPQQLTVNSDTSMITYVPHGKRNEYGIVRYKIDESGNTVLDEHGQPIVEDEMPELIIYSSMTLRPYLGFTHEVLDPELKKKERE